MIYDASGRPMRRAIGFEPKLRREETPKCGLATFVCGFAISTESDEEEVDHGDQHKAES